jgi:hypothetical protein
MEILTEPEMANSNCDEEFAQTEQGCLHAAQVFDPGE